MDWIAVLEQTAETLRKAAQDLDDVVAEARK
jgi:hypothetical protein